MKLTVLLDNNTLIDRYFLGEPGVSYFIEADGKKVLFDVGYSDAFVRNAQKMGIDLLDIDFIVLSHGHLDHTWGLMPLIQLYTEGMIEKRAVKRPSLVAHPGVLDRRKHQDATEIGAVMNADVLGRFFDLQWSRGVVRLTENLFFLGEIERSNDFEAQKPLGVVNQDGREVDDYLMDDTALVYKSTKGLIIITGCSHSGICNIVEYARKVCGEQRVVDIIGGFHLLEPSREQLQGTMAYFEVLNPDCVHACHCTDLSSKIVLSGIVPVKEVGVGLVLAYEMVAP